MKADLSPALPEMRIPSFINDAIAQADPSWHATLVRGIEAVAQAASLYLSTLTPDNHLPNGGRLFSAFRQPLKSIRYVLIGEGPYPRLESATGLAFMDGAVDRIWSDTGLSKQVNRATSLRNFFKMLLVAEGLLHPEKTSGDALMSVAETAKSPDAKMIQVLGDLQGNLLAEGFLLLNASLVFRPSVPPIQDGKAWQPFLREVLRALRETDALDAQRLPTLVLWGKVAAQVAGVEIVSHFPQVISEHPYNLSFITNQSMQALFAPMKLLNKRSSLNQQA